jgi:chemotaxis family two-component system sensor kinase Cph1
VESQGQPFEELDSRQILQQALDNLRRKIQNNDAQVTADGLGPVIADGTQLTQVFQNLIGNAVKFRGTDPPQIQVRAQYREGEVEFSVCDNGIGIDPRYHERVFTVFQRLHSQDQYPGTGIGLAICYRIVQRHGGRIWVESDGGPGCCFRFTLPQPPRSEPKPDESIPLEEGSS